MAELSHTAKWKLDEIEKATAELRKEVIRLETALDESTGLVQQLKPYPLDSVMRTTLQGYGSPEAARRAAERAYEASLPVLQDNAGIIDANQRILSRIKQVIINAGLPEKVSVRRPRSRYKTEAVETDWSQSLRMHIPVYDPGNDLDRRYKEWLTRCDEWRRKLDAEAAAAQRAREEENRKVEREIVRRELVGKYSLDADADPWTVRERIISRHKYLYLAHYLEANRGDWSEGCDYALTGLGGFKVETDRDREVEREIRSFCADWDGDGRIFRDCKWSYPVLYAIVSEEAPELLADYRKIQALIGD